MSSRHMLIMLLCWLSGAALQDKLSHKATTENMPVGASCLQNRLHVALYSLDNVIICQQNNGPFWYKSEC